MNAEEWEQVGVAIHEALERGKEAVALSAPEMYEWRWTLIEEDVRDSVRRALEVGE